MCIEDIFFNTTDFKLQEKKLGEGGFGTVYVSHNIKDDKLYATKIIKLHDEFNGHDQMLLMREAIIHQQLNHPGIVGFKGVNFQSFNDSKKLEPSIITEYLPRGSLKEILKQEQKCIADFAWDATKKYITLLGISHAMKYLHEHGIVHRDLKPENILVDDNYYPLISDFGLAHCFPKTLSNNIELTMTGQIGTPLYMAPELLRGDKKYTGSVDVYAFSMIAYEIVAGKVPFSEEGEIISPVTIGMKVINGHRPKFPVYVSNKMQNLISRCWSDNHEERPSFDEIYQELSTNFSAFDDNLNEDEINDYIEILNEKREEKDGVLFSGRKELEELKNQMKEKEKIFNEGKKECDELKGKLNELKEKLNNFTSSNDIFILALHNLLGNKKERNKNNAISFLKTASEKGNCYASYLLGLHYANDKCEKHDFNNAKSYFQRATDQGNSNGLNAIGYYYMNGYGIERSYHMAIEYLKKSSKLGNSNAKNNLGVLYHTGNGVSQDFGKAEKYFEESATLENPIGLYFLGSFYIGHKNENKYIKAKERFELASNTGCISALNSIGNLYCNGCGVEKDYLKAKEYYEKSFNLGNLDALVCLGDLYLNGYGVEKSFSKAKELYEKSFQLGNINALVSIGNIYLNGNGVKINYSKAKKYYEKAVKLGDPSALIDIGKMYDNGLGVKMDKYKAQSCYKESHRLGNHFAACYIERDPFIGMRLTIDLS